MNIFFKKILIFVQKWVSGVPYLKNRPSKFCIMHLKSKNLEFLLMCNGHIRWKSLLMFYRTVIVVINTLKWLWEIIRNKHTQNSAVRDS